MKDDDFSVMMQRVVETQTHIRAQRIERELEGRNVLVVSAGDQFIIYRVPGWREAPRRRARIALIRARRRIERWRRR